MQTPSQAPSMNGLPSPTSFSPMPRRRALSATGSLGPADATAGQGMAPGGAGVAGMAVDADASSPGTTQPVTPPQLPVLPPPGTPQATNPLRLSPRGFQPSPLRPGHALPLAPLRLAPASPMSPQPPLPPPLPVSPPALPGADAAGGAAATTPIDPSNDLRSRAILPDTATDTKGRDELASFFGPTDVGAGAEVAPAGSARLLHMGSLVDSAAGNLASVDRVQRAKDLLGQFDEDQAPEHERALRNITNQYLQRGGGKSGMLRTAYGDEDLVRQRDRDAMKRKVIGDAVEGSIADEFNKTSALSGLESGLSDREAGERGERRGERAYRTGLDEGNVNRRLATREAVNATSTTDAARRRAEVRGERGYQNDLEQRSFERMLGQDQYEQSDVDRRLQRALSLLGAGEAGNPSSILAALSASGGMDPALIASLAQMLGRGTAGGGSAGRVPSGRTLPSEAGSPV